MKTTASLTPEISAESRPRISLFFPYGPRRGKIHPMKNYSKEQETSFAIGFFSVIQLLESHPEKVVSVYVAEDSLNSEGYQKVLSLVDKKKIIVSTKAIERISKKENGHVMAEFKKWHDNLSPEKDHLVMVNPMDKGNLGNAVRSLLAFGFHDLAIIEPCADDMDPKTIRASMGALFHIRVERFPSFEAYLAKYPRSYYPFVLRNAKPMKEVVFSSPLALVFGNEATGLPDSIQNENNVFIEQSDEVDSLNLTTSIAIALYRLRMDRGY